MNISSPYCGISLNEDRIIRSHLVWEPHHPLDAEPKLELAELGCTGTSWPGLLFSGKSACSSPSFLL